MTIDKAIEILRLQINLPSPNLNPDLISANILSIEALKRLAFNRLNTIASSHELLPGETIE